MPIVGSPVPSVTVNAPLTTIFQSTPILQPLDLPGLTSIYTPPTQCADRWMLLPNLGATTSCGMVTVQSGTDLVQDCTTIPAPSPTIFSADHVSNPYSDNTASDPYYTRCQPYSVQPTYSPGICPDGHTIADMAEIQYNGTANAVETFWQASCCRSGMTFANETAGLCAANFTEPLSVHAYVTTVITSGSIVTQIDTTIAYEFINTAFVTTAVSDNVVMGEWMTSTQSSMITVPTGLALHDPIVVRWQVKDLSLFPQEVSSSLAEALGVATSTPPGSQETGPTAPSKSSGLSSGARAGIGVGVTVAVVALGAIVLAWVLNNRRKKQPQEMSAEQRRIYEMEDHDQSLAGRKWFLWGKWRNETHGEEKKHEIDGRPIHVVPGPPAELEAQQQHDHIDDRARR